MYYNTMQTCYIIQYIVSLLRILNIIMHKLIYNLVQHNVLYVIVYYI